MRVRFHLPDFVRFARFNLLFINMLETSPELFREGVEIASVYGVFPPSVWNGGRTVAGVCDKNYVRSIVKAYEKKGIPLRFTFTNPILEKKHLSDNFCNTVMHLADNGLNEVIVMSPLLERYIRENYPNYKLNSSTCKRITDEDGLMTELAGDYHTVVLDYDLNHRMDLLEKIADKDRIEILVNPLCNPHCPNRSLHYQSIGTEQLYIADFSRKHPDSVYYPDQFKREHPEFEPVFSCKCENRTLFDITGLKNHVSPDEIWNVYAPMGFRQFKIEGRNTDPFNLLEHYIYYMIKPEHHDYVHMQFMRNLYYNQVLEFHEG